MRKVSGVIFVLLMIAAAPSWAAMSFVSGNAGITGFNNFTSPIVTATFGSASSSGSVIMVCEFWDPAAGNPTSVTGAGGSAGTLTDSGLGVVNNAPGGYNAQCGAFLAPASGITSVSANWSGTQPAFSGIGIWEVTGAALPALVDGKSVNNSTGTATPTSNNTATLAQAIEPAIGWCLPLNAFTAQGAGWTLDQINGTGGFMTEHMVTSATTPIAATGTQSGADPAQMWVMTIKDQTAPGAGGPPLRTILGLGK